MPCDRYELLSVCVCVREKEKRGCVCTFLAGGESIVMNLP